MFVEKSRNREKHGFGLLHNLNRVCYHCEDILLLHLLLFKNEVGQIPHTSLLRCHILPKCETKRIICEVVIFTTKIKQNSLLF